MSLKSFMINHTDSWTDSQTQATTLTSSRLHDQGLRDQGLHDQGVTNIICCFVEYQIQT